MWMPATQLFLLCPVTESQGGMGTAQGQGELQSLLAGASLGISANSYRKHVCYPELAVQQWQTSTTARKRREKISGSKIVTPGPQTTPKAVGKCPKPEDPPKALQRAGSLTVEELTMTAHLLPGAGLH